MRKREVRWELISKAGVKPYNPRTKLKLIRMGLLDTEGKLTEAGRNYVNVLTKENITGINMGVLRDD